METGLVRPEVGKLLDFRRRTAETGTIQQMRRRFRSSNVPMKAVSTFNPSRRKAHHTSFSPA